VVDLSATTISVREAEVLNALGEHLTNAQIAQQLHISVRTVESHVSSLLRKLGAADRRERLRSTRSRPPR
jgi:DNA-binding NarL/FixJ family response regulator